MDAILTVHVQPKARDNSIVGFDAAHRLKVRVTAPPTDGAANEAVCAVIAGALHIRSRQVSVEHGHTSRTKTVRIEGMSREQAERLLGT